MEKTPIGNGELLLNLNESASYSTSSKIQNKNTNTSKNKNKYSSYSSSSLSTKRKKFNEVRRNMSGFINNDKIEKKMYLDKINMRAKRNSELLYKLSSTFRSCRIQANNKDPKIEANLFRIGVKRSYLLSKRVNQVRNMIQNFDNEFTVNLNINNKKTFPNKNVVKKPLQKIEEESFDFDLNNINKNEPEKNKRTDSFKSQRKSMKKSLLILGNSPESIDALTLKGKKFLRNNEKIEKKLKNEKKFCQLEDAFKYYELLYNYKYFLTQKDNEFLSFSRRKKLEKESLSNYLKNKKKISEGEKNCEKCKNKKKIDLKKYINGNKILSIYNYSENENDKNYYTPENTSNENKHELILSLGNSEKTQKNLKRVFSSFTRQNIFTDIKINNHDNSIFKNKTRPTTSSIYSSNYINSIKLNKNIKNELDIDSAISNTSIYNTIFTYNKTQSKNNKKKSSSSPSSVKKVIRSMSEGILSIGDKLKTDLKSTYKSIMKKIEEDKKPVQKVKKDRNININKIRQDLHLKRRGNFIDEEQLIMNNVDKLYKSLPKRHVNLMRSIAKIVINEDRMRNKPLIYNDIYDNKLFKMRLKKEMFDAENEMAKIRKKLNKNKTVKDFKERMKKLMENDMFLFFNLNSLKQMVNKYKVLRGECLSNN